MPTGCRGRGKAIDVYQVIDLSSGHGQAKSPLYGRLLRSMMEDQVSWVRDRARRFSHVSFSLVLALALARGE